MRRPCSNSRRAKASSVNAAGSCTGAVGGAAGVRVMPVDAVGCDATAGASGVDETAAAVSAGTWGVKAELLPRTVGPGAGPLPAPGFGRGCFRGQRRRGSAAAPFTATGFGGVFFGVNPGAGARAGSVDEVTAVLSGGFI